MKNSFLKLVIVITFLFIVGGGLLFLLKKDQVPTNSPSSSETHYMTSDRNKIFIYKDIFASNSLTKTFEYSQVYDFYNKNAVVTKQDEVFLIEFENNGNIKRQVDLGSKPDLVLSTISKIFMKDSKTYFLYLVPLRGIRVFKIDSQNNVDEHFYKYTQSIRIYTDNKIFLTDNGFIVPAGDLRFYRLQLDSDTISDESISPEACGDGVWKINHNENELFVLKTDTEICLYNFNENKAIKKISSDKNTWYKFIPEKNLLLAEPWENTNGFPNSVGKIKVYDLNSNNNLDIDLSGNSDFIKERSGSPGGYSLISSYYLNGENIYLTTRAGKDVYLTQLDNNLQLVKFFSGQKIFYEKTTSLQI